MTDFDQLKIDINDTNKSLAGIIESAHDIPGLSNEKFQAWRQTCHSITQQLDEEMIRVAVVGAIKSGKSTFVNALLADDYLKRGAGVVTSFVTKIRRGHGLKAELFFKSWDEINRDIEQARVLLPTVSPSAEAPGFDLRRERDRAALKQSIDNLDSALWLKDGVRNPATMLLTCYLDGYQRARDQISADKINALTFENDAFANHRKWVSDDCLSVYLNDIRLEIQSTAIAGQLEIADCQGSDSPNPMHLAMIQDYLFLTNHIIYVISSRTGLRQADIRFLSMIAHMGIMDNIQFVVNCDLSEHESIDDLRALVTKIENELTLFKPDIEVHAFSALYNLFDANRNILSPKDRVRYEQWHVDNQLIAYSNEQTRRFLSSFIRRHTGQRARLLFNNHIERLAVARNGLSHWIDTYAELLAQQPRERDKILQKVTRHQQKVQQIKGLISSTVNGARQSVKNELKIDVDRFFDDRSGEIVPEVANHIRQHSPNMDGYVKNLAVIGFPKTLYLLFQDVRDSLNAFMAQTVNPRILKFIKQEEDKIGQYLETVYSPYDALVRDAIVEHDQAIADLDIDAHIDQLSGAGALDMETIKTLIGIDLPPAAAALRYHPKIKTEAMVRFSFYKFVAWVKHAVQKNRSENGHADALRALRNALYRIKQDMEAGMDFHFKSYRENLKFQYMFKLTDAAASHLQQLLLERFQIYAADLAAMTAAVNAHQRDRQSAQEQLQLIQSRLTDVQHAVERIRANLAAGRKIILPSRSM